MGVLEEHQGFYGAQRYKAMAAVALAVLMSVLDYAVANVALPTIAGDLHVSASQSIWVINAYQLAALALVLPLASVGSRIGYAKMCLIGIGIFLVASVFCALSTSLLEMALARALQGAGGSCIMSVNLALVRFIYPRGQLGRGIALNGLTIGLGVALGPTVGSTVLSFANWPWIFWINLPIGAIAFLLGWFALPRTPQSNESPDLLAAILLICAFTLTVIGADTFVHGGAWLGGSAVVAGIACAVTLLRYQRRFNEPMMPVDMLRLPVVLSAFLVGISAFISSNLFIIAMPFTLEILYHRPANVTGFLITPWPCGVAALSFLVGRWADRYPASTISSIGLSITGAAFLSLWLLPATVPDWSIIWRIGVAGMGFGMFQPPNNRALMLGVPKGREGSASGLFSVSRLGGQTLGALLVAAVFRFNAHPSKTCLLWATVVAFLGALMSVGRLSPSASSMSKRAQ